MTVLEFNVPAPPSANRIWRYHKGRVTKSQEYKSWLRDASWALLEQLPGVGRLQPSELKAELSIILHPANGNHKRRDVDNYLKPIGDMLEHAGVLKDDNQIYRIVATRGSLALSHHVAVTLEFVQRPG